MKEDLLNIFSSQNEQIDNEKLMNYLANRLSPEERHDFEQQLLDSDLLNDAVEGLGAFNNQNDITALTRHLNKNLKKQLDKRKKLKLERKIRDLPWLYLAIVLVLLIILISFLVIRKHLE